MTLEIQSYNTGRDYGIPQVLYYVHDNGRTIMYDYSREVSYIFDSILSDAALLKAYDYGDGDSSNYEVLTAFENRIKAALS